jgi:hypothetical protein
MEHSPWEVNSRSAGQEIPRSLWNMKIRRSLHKNPSLDSVLSHIDLVHILKRNFFTVPFKTVPIHA